MMESNIEGIKYIQTGRNSFKVLPNNICEISTVTNFLVSIAKKKSLLDFAMLAAEPFFSGSDLIMF